MASSAPDPVLQPHPHALDEAQIAKFISDGYLLLRDCFPVERARELVHGSLVKKNPMPSYRCEVTRQPKPIADIDLMDPACWPLDRLNLETGRSYAISQFAPKLWGALVSLVGSPSDIERTTMGEQWILNGNFEAPPAPPLTAEVYTKGKWHIDEVSQQTTLEGRRDALALLILWSDVDPGGGGPLHSGQSLSRVVAAIESSERGLDTTGRTWGCELVRECTDVTELTGKAGDVLITHALSLHSPSPNYSRRVRILENPTIRCFRTLDYSPDNPEPTPVEACVIARRTKRASASRRREPGLRESMRELCTLHPDYFLPERRAWCERVPADKREAVHDLDRALSRQWTKQVGEQILARNSSTLGRLRAAVGIFSELFVNQLSVHAHLAESCGHEDFADTSWSRLVRGFASCEGQNYALLLVLREIFDDVGFFNTIDPETQAGDHMLLWVQTKEGWTFADAWGPNRLFYVEGIGDGALPGVPEYAELALQGHQPRLGSISREAYVKGHRFEAPLPSPSRRSHTQLADSIREDRKLFDPADPVAASRAWRSYLDARMFHLMGEQRAALDGYQTLQEALNPRSMTARVAAAFAERLAAHTSLLRL